MGIWAGVAIGGAGFMTGFGFEVGWGGGGGGGGVGGVGTGAVGVVGVEVDDIGDVGEAGAEMLGEGISERLMSERLVSAAAKEPGRVLTRGNVGRDETLKDLPLVLPEGLLWDAEEYAARDQSVSFVILDRSAWLRVVGGIFAKRCTHATVYRGLGYELISYRVI